MADYFANSRAKLWRANQQFYALYSYIERLFNAKEHRTRVDTRHKTQPKSVLHIDQREWIEFTTYFANTPRLTKEFGVMAGEVLHNFRSALDHLAWDLVRLVGTQNLTSKQRRKIYFPLTTSSEFFWGSKPGVRPFKKSVARRKLPGVPDDPFLTLIERYQPYRRTAAGRAMRSLRNLSDTDKHRLVLPALVLPQRTHFDVEFEGGVILDRKQLIRAGDTIKPGTEIMWYLVARAIPGRKIKVTMKARGTIIPSFPRSLVRPPPGDPVPAEVPTTLREIGSICLEILNEVEAHM